MSTRTEDIVGKITMVTFLIICILLLAYGLGSCTRVASFNRTCRILGYDSATGSLFGPMYCYKAKTEVVETPLEHLLDEREDR